MPAILMRAYRWTLATAASSCLLVWSVESYGQASAVAEKLFRQAVDYMKADNFSAACPLLERSYQMDPKDGTLFTLANCRDREGKLVAAMGHYRAYLRGYDKMQGATRQNHTQRADTAKTQLAAIEPTVPMLKFIWETPPPPNSKIIVDGVEFRAAELDILLPLDPGTHKVVVQLPGEPDRSRTVTLGKGGSTIIDLTPAKPAAVDATKLNAALGAGSVPVQTRKMDPAKIAGFVGVGLGAAGLVAGAITGSMAMTEKDTIDERCDADYVCDAVGMAAVGRFRTVGNVSTAAFITGGVFLGVGATLLIVSRPARAHSGANVQLRTAFAPGTARFSIEGAF